ncbi:MAG TPA: hypothetical protein PLA74_10195 [Syntrophales bacterium]|nr:hypothetical protein [Syntrophales bacterium]HPQ45528.1 hypothetical protein [Syntrophales bacterium]
MKRPALHIVLFLVISLGLIHTGFAYIPSAEQILRPFQNLYNGLHTVKIDMKTVLYSRNLLDETDITEVSEQILIKRGGIFRSERSFPYGDNILIQDEKTALNLGVETSNAGARRIDTVFPTLFFQTSVNNLLNALSALGVDTGTVRIDRMDGKTVFIAGKDFVEEPGSLLWIERERALPLRFVGIGMSGEERIVLRAEYRNYRQVSKRFWFPERIEYYRDDVLWVVSTLKDITINEELPEVLFRISEEENVGTPVTHFLNIKE